MVRSVTYGMRDIGDGDTVIRTGNGIVLRNGIEEMHMSFPGLREYAEWVIRNADRLGDPDPEVTRCIAKGLLASLDGSRE